MPLYEYLCSQCGNRFEHLELHSSPAPECPSCHSLELSKMMSRSAVSSSGTRTRALRGAQERTQKLRYEREHEAHKVAHDHDD